MNNVMQKNLVEILRSTNAMQTVLLRGSFQQQCVDDIEVNRCSSNNAMQMKLIKKPRSTNATLKKLLRNFIPKQIDDHSSTPALLNSLFDPILNRMFVYLRRG